MILGNKNSEVFIPFRAYRLINLQGGLNSFIIAKTRMRKSVSNFVTSKMSLLKSERLVYKNVHPMRRWGIGGMRYHIVKNHCEDGG